MIINVHQPNSHLWHVIDNDTGKEIKGVQSANDKTGNYIVLKFDKSGEVAWCVCPKCGDGHAIELKKHGNIKLVRKM